jgi:dTDP-4-dehydrorhamnose reductase
MKILILGSEGMLGREILFQLTNVVDRKVEIFATCRGEMYSDNASEERFNAVTQFDASKSSIVLDVLNRICPDVVINCIGVIKQHGSTISEHRYFYLNACLPRIINVWCKNRSARLLHFSTDCVFSGKKGDYSLKDKPDAFDIYGLSKILGEVDDSNSLTIRTSIVGLERKSNQGLLSWFFSNPDESSVNGYDHVLYSGLTTSYLAGLVVEKFLDHNYSGLIQLGGPKISKYDLLSMANEVFSRNIHINKHSKIRSDKSLSSDSIYLKLGISQPSWKELLVHLRDNSIETNTKKV